SLNYDPAVLSTPVVTLGSGAFGATVNFNDGSAGSGRLGVSVSYPATQTFTTGTRQLVGISFNVAANAPIGSTPITFGDNPVVSQITDAFASMLTTVYTPGSVNVLQPNPIPMLIGLAPSSAAAGSGSFTLTVVGSNFVNGASVRFNGISRNTTFVSDSKLLALIPATDIANAGTVTVTAVNPAPGGGASNGLTFTIGNGVPSI